MTPSLLFSDDFAGDVLDRDRWTVGITGHVVNDEQQAYVDSPETIYIDWVEGAERGDGRCLVLHPRHCPGFTVDGRRFDFVSGRIDTRATFRFRYGSLAARMRLPAGPGLWSAFWALGTGPWPDTGEIDVMENVGEPDWLSAAVHGPGYSGESGLVNRRFFDPGEDAIGWHVYAATWRPAEITFTVDGRVAHRVTRPMVGFFGAWAFDDEKFLVLNLAVGGTYPFKTTGTRSPYLGVAGETVALIREDRVRVLVDSVRVTAV